MSKGFGLIERFSEDIDLRIDPTKTLGVATGRNQNKPKQADSRQAFYDWLADNILIDGIEVVERDRAFDDAKFRSGGIRLHYKPTSMEAIDLKDGVLLEVGFHDVTPDQAADISSWAYDYAADRVDIIDNRALGILCYLRGIPSLKSSRRSLQSTAHGDRLANFQVIFCATTMTFSVCLETPMFRRLWEANSTTTIRKDAFPRKNGT